MVGSLLWSWRVAGQFRIFQGCSSMRTILFAESLPWLKVVLRFYHRVQHKYLAVNFCIVLDLGLKLFYVRLFTLLVLHAHRLLRYLLPHQIWSILQQDICGLKRRCVSLSWPLLALTRSSRNDKHYPTVLRLRSGQGQPRNVSSRTTYCTWKAVRLDKNNMYCSGTG